MQIYFLNLQNYKELPIYSIKKELKKNHKTGIRNEAI